MQGGHGVNRRTWKASEARMALALGGRRVRNHPVNTHFERAV